jgi:hypothetical protein
MYDYDYSLEEKAQEIWSENSVPCEICRKLVWKFEILCSRCWREVDELKRKRKTEKWLDEREKK